MVAISRSKVSIYIAPVDTNPSVITGTYATSVKVSGEIVSYSRSGGEDDIETVPVFGGFVDKEKPKSQYEMDFEVIPALDSNQDRWDALIYGTVNNVYASNLDAVNKAIFIAAVDGTNVKSYAFNNCNGVSWELEHNADDNQTGTFKFKFSPSTPTGIANFQTKATALTSLPAWSTLTS